MPYTVQVRISGKDTEICKQKVHWECWDAMPVRDEESKIGHREKLHKRLQLILSGVWKLVQLFRIPVESRDQSFFTPIQLVIDVVCLQGVGITSDKIVSFSRRQLMWKDSAVSLSSQCSWLQEECTRKSTAPYSYF